ncbi:MAG: hypothetical protein IKO81_05720, partial [Bacteroidales bacterium]|nr:hypothetical protein [Bacteroidales bacterium]
NLHACSQGILMSILLPRPSGTPSTIEGEFARTGTACRSRKWRANESVGIANSKVWAANAFF